MHPLLPSHSPCVMAECSWGNLGKTQLVTLWVQMDGNIVAKHQDGSPYCE
jgi:hypothetical protein